jgi:cell fate (sporulation/competence/biofilm development) regulator YlbF (YheA/YmcA/DUF963 family)
MKTQTIESKTKEYIESLKETEEIMAYKKALDDFENDNEAKKLLTDYQEAQQTYNVFRQGGFDGLKEVEQKARDLNYKLQKNQKIQSLIKTQRSAQYLVANLVDDISRGINIPFVKPQQGGCCG